MDFISETPFASGKESCAKVMSGLDRGGLLLSGRDGDGIEIIFRSGVKCLKIYE